MAYKASRTVVSCPNCGHSVPVPHPGKRIRAGLSQARQNGVRLGRPPVVDRQHVRKLRAEGITIRAIASRLDIAASTVSAALRSFSQHSPSVR